jgi:hypothetical protein
VLLDAFVHACVRADARAHAGLCHAQLVEQGGVDCVRLLAGWAERADANADRWQQVLTCGYRRGLWRLRDACTRGHTEGLPAPRIWPVYRNSATDLKHRELAVKRYFLPFTEFSDTSMMPARYSTERKYLHIEGSVFEHLSIWRMGARWGGQSLCTCIAVGTCMRACRHRQWQMRARYCVCAAWLVACAG